MQALQFLCYQSMQRLNEALVRDGSNHAECSPGILPDSHGRKFVLHITILRQVC
jgi:hypothetical protein